MAEIVQLFGTLRQQTHVRTSWLLNLTTDIGIPVIAALSCNGDGGQLAYGLAARLSATEAVRGAILELCQTELAIQLAAIKRMELGEENLLPTDRAHLERDAVINAHQCELLHPLGVHLMRPEKLIGPQLATIVNALARCSIEAALIDLTRPEFGIPVVRAVAPVLQPLPSLVVTDRLRRAVTDHGGGDRYTGGLALIS